MTTEAKKKAKREFNPMSLSFLDVMSCGFGAVVLIFLILDHSQNQYRDISTPQLAAEISLLEEEILQGEAGLVRIRNTLSDIDLETVEAQGLARQIQDELDTLLEELATMENETLASDESVEDLKSDIQSLEEELRRLRGAEAQMTGSNIRPFVGEGNRQYLTGLLLGGNRILVLVDTSASMLDHTIVNIIRRRNMSEEVRINSEKWVGVKEIVDWLTTQLPPPSEYQILLFNDEVQTLLPETEGQWLQVGDQDQLDEAVENLHEVIPDKGTNMENLFLAVQQFRPLPDNIYLITDGLPTLDNSGNRRTTISGRDRERLFERALRELPPGIPVNVILAPLEGDPMAASLYWKLAITTGGAFLSPSEDWP